jgi:cytosine/adenosine deaminase-related metal-dependent hydrolase
MLLRAKYLLWRAGEPPLENAAVEIRGQHIGAVGKFRSFSRRTICDLGEVVLLPGLVNAHCHLNYTHLAGKIPSDSFVKWLRQMIALKRAATPEIFGASVRDGLRQLQASGVTTVCDIVSDTGKPDEFYDSVGKNFAEVDRSPLRVWSCFELLDLGRFELARMRVALALDLRNNSVRRVGGFGLAPHSPYAASIQLLAEAGSASSRHRLLLTVHIAESQEEFEMFAHHRGALCELMSQFDGRWLLLDKTTPVGLLDRLRLLSPRTLGVHMNYLGEQDFEIVARSRMSVAHCPRSHEYFGHSRFAAERLLGLGVNVCLGTDSAASIGSGQRSETAAGRLGGGPPQPLDMFEEMRCFHRHHPTVAPRQILRMATLNGARALGRQQQLGSIERGKLADLIAVPAAPKPRGIEEAIIYSSAPVCFSMVGGKRLADQAQ